MQNSNMMEGLETVAGVPEDARTLMTAPAPSGVAGAIGRRGALALIGGVITAGIVRADELPGGPPVATPLPTPLPSLPATVPPNVTVTPARPATPPAPPAAAGSLGPIDKEKTHFVYFQQAIDLQTIKSLRNDLITLMDGGVKEITLVITSGGGLVMPALQLYSLIRSLPIKINTHAQVFVGSAATLLYLAGEERTTDANVRFLFHPSQFPISGAFSPPQFNDQVELVNASEETVRSIYRERTKLPDSEIKRYQHEAVFYDAAKAVEFGVAQQVAPLAIPGGGKARMIFVD